MTQSLSPFERIRRTNPAGNEFWSSRDFAKVLDYSDYRNFEAVVEKARTACFNSGQRVEDHFVGITEMIEIGKGGQRPVATRHRQITMTSTPLGAASFHVHQRRECQRNKPHPRPLPHPLPTAHCQLPTANGLRPPLPSLPSVAGRAIFPLVCVPLFRLRDIALGILHAHQLERNSPERHPLFPRMGRR